MKKIMIAFVLSLTLFIVACGNGNGETENGMAVISISTTAGSVEDITVEPSTEVEPGTQVTVEAPEVDNYSFEGWMDEDGSLVSAQNPYVFTAYENVTLVASYDSDHGGTPGLE